MHQDVTDLIAFYDSPFGQLTRRLVRRKLRALWPHVPGARVLGLGYATPYLRPFMGEAERVAGAMFASQGVTHWPLGERGLTALVEDPMLPFADSFFDRVLLVHGFETSEAVPGLMEELHRVLTPEGRILAVVPNRRSLWARAEETPFGHGRPYSRTQLRRVFTRHHFEVTGEDGALYVPPVRSRAVMAASAAWERVGAKAWPRFSGVLLLEAGKRTYAPVKAQPARVPVRRRQPALQPAVSCEGRPARHLTTDRPS